MLIFAYMRQSSCRRRQSMQIKGMRIMWLRITQLVKVSLFLITAVTASSAHAQSSSWKPEKHVEIITGASPGATNDRVARSIQKILQDKQLLSVTSSVINKVGGGNAMSWAYLNQHVGNGGYLAIANPNLLTNQITGRSPQSYRDFSPLAMLLSEYVSFVVRADSPIKNGAELIERFKKDPGSLSISVGSAIGGANHLAIVKAVEAVGGDSKQIKPVVFNGTGEAMMALVGGHIGAISGTPSNAIAYAKAGKVRVLIIFAPQRLSGIFANVPTFKEHGFDTIVNNWRGLIGPKGLTPAQIAFWDSTLSKLTAADEWQKEADKLVNVVAYMNSEQTAKYLEAQHAELRKILAALGLAK